jgi:hypothetical protein
MPRPVKELTNMEIDEVSLVSRPANAHARVVIAKSQEDNVPDVFDSEGMSLDIDSISLGEVVYSDGGEPFVVVEDDHSEDLVSIGKADEEDDMDNEEPKEESTEDKKKNPFAAFASEKKDEAKKPKAKEEDDDEEEEDEEEDKEPEVKKSFANELREDFAKSLTDMDRDEAIVKAMDQVESMGEALEEARTIAKSERDLRLEAEYEEVAKSYNVPIDPVELAPVLRDIAEYLPYEHGAIIHKALSAAGDMLFDEIGTQGAGSNNDVLNEVNAFIDQNVSKSDDISKAEATEAIFDSNPQAYDEYISTRYNV